MPFRRWLFALGAAVLLHSNVAAHPATMTVQQEIQPVITKLLHAIDALDWSGVRRELATEVRVDYTSLFGGNAEQLPSDSLVARWRGLLPGFDATQHIIGPLVVTGGEGDSVTAETQVRGYHYVKEAEGGSIWMAAGRYEFRMVRSGGTWRIAGITFHLAYQEGNLGLPAVAQARAARGPRSRK